MPGKQEKSVYVVRFSRMSVNDPWEWTFTSRKAAELTMRRVQANPRNLHVHIIERELMARAPKADVVSAEIGLAGVVTNPAGPFAESEERTTVTLELVRLWDKHLLYTGPGTSKKQAALDANQTRKKLADMGLWPREEDIRTLVTGYGNLPWWLTRPPEAADPEMPKALYGLVLCPDCNQQMVETEMEGDLLYSCPQGALGINPDCRSKAVPAEDARKRIISTLIERFAGDTDDQLKLCRQLQGDSQDPDYHRSPSPGTPGHRHGDTPADQKNDRLRMPPEKAGRETGRTRKHQGGSQSLLGERRRSSHRPGTVRALRRGHARTEIARYLSSLLMCDDSQGNLQWTKEHLRCAEVIPEHEIVHYRGRTGEDNLIWEKADINSHLDRVENRE